MYESRSTTAINNRQRNNILGNSTQVRKTIKRQAVASIKKRSLFCGSILKFFENIKPEVDKK